MQQLADASRARLKNWDIADSPNAPGTDKSRVTFRAPVTGIVLEKKAVQGMRFMPGETGCITNIVNKTDQAPPSGVDTEQDLQVARRLFTSIQNGFN